MAKPQLTEEHKMRMRDHMVEGLRESVKRGLSRVPESVLDVIETEAWKKRYVEKLGRETGFDKFEDFVKADPLDGLGTSLDQLYRVCRGTPAEIKIDEVTVGEQGGNKNPEGRNQYTEVNDNNINNDHRRTSPVGTSRQFALRKLRKEANKEAERGDEPKIALLYERVIAGEISPHAAMVEAGFRKKMLTVPADVRAAARVLVKHFDAHELCEAIIEAGEL